MLGLEAMTLNQLQAFVLVARLGSLTAAARALGVSEPAVAAALASLRRQLGDPLVERGPSGMALSPAGRRLVGLASQMVALGVEAEAAVRQANGAPERLRITSTGAIAESSAPALLDAFTSRAAAIEVSLVVVQGVEMPALLAERLCDVALGPRLSGDGDLESIPLLRYRLAVVAGPTHRLAARSSLGPKALATETWLVDPDANDPTCAPGQVLERLGVPETRIRVFPSQAAAWLAAEEGQGVALAALHLVTTELTRGSLRLLEVTGFPVELLWYATMLRPERRSPAASALRHFLATPAATHAMHAPSSGTPPGRFRPPVHVTIWS